jgi:hypothetical protein
MQGVFDNMQEVRSEASVAVSVHTPAICNVTVLLHTNLPTFWMNMLPPSSEWKNISVSQQTWTSINQKTKFLPIISHQSTDK